MMINVKRELVGTMYEEFKKIVISSLEQKQASEENKSNAVDSNAENKGTNAEVKDGGLSIPTNHSR